MGGVRDRSYQRQLDSVSSGQVFDRFVHRKIETLYQFRHLLAGPCRIELCQKSEIFFARPVLVEHLLLADIPNPSLPFWLVRVVAQPANADLSGVWLNQAH